MKMPTPIAPPFNVNPDGSLSYRTELVIAQERIKKLEAVLRECREFWWGTDAPILTRIDEALS